jgi:hypothetical protein
MARSEPLRSRRGRLALGAAVALALPFAVACNSLIGLSDFEKGQCAGARCPDEGGLVDQLVEGGTDAPQDAPVDAKGADPVSWAKWPMPNYIEGGGGGGMPLSSPALVSVAGSGIVTDTVTKLVWRAALAPGDFSATEAQSACAKLPGVSGGQWRAPKRIELVTLLDYSRPSPFVDRNVFTDLKNFKVWSTSEVRPFVAGNPAQPYWVVNFETGAVEPLAGDLSAKVLCVLAK